MPKFKLETQSKHSAQDTFQRIRQVLEKDPELRKLDGKYTCKFNEGDLSGVATGQYFKAEMKIVGSANGAKVEIAVDLPLMMSPFKGMVEKTLQKKIDSTLA